mgnify:CR=1 FL=1
MPRFAANLTMLFTELPLQQRFAAAAAAGFEGAEILFPYDIAVSDLSRAAIRAGLEIVRDVVDGALCMLTEVPTD